jgi:hypothetical protein
MGFQKYRDNKTGEIREGIEIAHDPGEPSDPVLSTVSSCICFITAGLIDLPDNGRPEHGTYQDKESGELRSGTRAR